MLLNADIPNSLARDEDLLVEQLYIFLETLINKRLYYEDQSTKEDCIQDTIMNLLTKVRNLTDEELSKINFEKWIYNRANSYVSSIWLRSLNRNRKKLMLVSSMPASNKTGVPDNEDTEEYMLSLLNIINNPQDTLKNNVDINLKRLTKIIRQYNLDSTLEEVVLEKTKVLISRLSDKGLSLNIDKDIEDGDIIVPVIVAVIDEYILEYKKILEEETDND